MSERNEEIEDQRGQRHSLQGPFQWMGAGVCAEAELQWPEEEIRNSGE